MNATSLLSASVLVAGLLVPGALLARALRLPVNVPTAFAGSFLALQATLLVGVFSGARVSFPWLSGGLLLISALAWAALRARPRAETAVSEADPIVPVGSVGLILVLVVMGAAIALRIGRNPLPGPDVEFRWAFLAEQLLRTGSLDFYPPRSDADFTVYFWAESIPPGVAVMHAWAFACAGGTEPAWTLPSVALTLWSIHETVWSTARRLAGARAAWVASVAAAGCPLLLWSASLGQETGLTALAGSGLAWALAEWRVSRAPRHAAMAGIFAATGATVREYGMVFPLLAASALLAGGARRREWTGALGPVSLSLMWPLRAAYLTGNPFFSLPFGDLLPVNDRFVSWIRSDAAALSGVLLTTEGWKDIGRHLLRFAPGALPGLVWLAWRARSDPAARAGSIAAAAFLALWAASVPYTNGGLFYSLRVLAPLLTLGAIATGVAFAGASTARPAFVAAAAVALAGFTLPPTLALPLDWRSAPWRNWPAFAKPTPLAGADDEVVRAVRADLAAKGRAGPVLVLTDAPGFQRRFAATGIGVVPPWSPQADALFAPAGRSADTAQRWRESRISHVVVTKWKANLDFFEIHSQWRKPPFRLRWVAETELFAVFAIEVDE